MIRVVTDSSCDLPEELAALHRIEIVPLKIRFGDLEFEDRTQLTQAQFWEKLASSTRSPGDIRTERGELSRQIRASGGGRAQAA